MTSGKHRTRRIRKLTSKWRTVVLTAVTTAGPRQFSRARTRTPDSRPTTELRADGRIRWTRCTAVTRNTPDTRRSWSVRRSRCTRLRICPNSCVRVTIAVGRKSCFRCSSCTSIVSPVNTARPRPRYLSHFGHWLHVLYYIIIILVIKIKIVLYIF